MNRRSNGKVMLKLAGLVRPLSGYMALAIAMGLICNLCAAFVTIFAGYGVLAALGIGSLSIVAALGLAAGLALILAYALTRRSIREPEELRRELNQRCSFLLFRKVREREIEIDREQESEIHEKSMG